MIKGVVFDLGNTLMHFAGDAQATVEEGALALGRHLAEHGVRVEPAILSQAFMEQRRQLARQARQERVEQRADTALFRTLEQLGQPAVDVNLAASAVEAFFAPEERQYVLYPGAAELLASLNHRHVRVGLISNATDHGLILRLLARFGLQHHFTAVMSSASHGRRKPEPAIFLAMLGQLGLPAAKVVMVGDTLGEDILGAQQSGMAGGILVDIDPNPANPALAGQVVPRAIVDNLGILLTQLCRTA